MPLYFRRNVNKSGRRGVVVKACSCVSVQEYYYRSSIPCALEDLDIRTRDGMSKFSLSKSCLNRDHRICIMKLYWPIQYSR